MYQNTRHRAWHIEVFDKSFLSGESWLPSERTVFRTPRCETTSLEILFQGIRTLEHSLEPAAAGAARAPEYTVPGQLRGAGGWTPREAPAEAG